MLSAEFCPQCGCSLTKKAQTDTFSIQEEIDNKEESAHNTISQLINHSTFLPVVSELQTKPNPIELLLKDRLYGLFDLDAPDFNDKVRIHFTEIKKVKEYIESNLLYVYSYYGISFYNSCLKNILGENIATKFYITEKDTTKSFNDFLTLYSENLNGIFSLCEGIQQQLFSIDNNVENLDKVKKETSRNKKIYIGGAIIGGLLTGGIGIVGGPIVCSFLESRKRDKKVAEFNSQLNEINKAIVELLNLLNNNIVEMYKIIIQQQSNILDKVFIPAIVTLFNNLASKNQVNTELLLSKLNSFVLEKYLKIITTKGEMYLNGVATEKNLSQAYTFFEKAAEKGFPEALNILGVMYIKGDYVDKDIQRAILLFQRAAKLNNASAIANLAQCYKKGYIKEDNSLESAYKLFLRAGYLGNLVARFEAGKCLFHGHGCVQNYKRALILIQDVAEENYPEALMYMGYFYDFGLEVKADKKKAVEYYNKANTAR